MNIDKKQLYLICQSQVSDKILEIKKSIDSARESSKNDTKSSMGDKYETTREMLQQEINMLEKQLSEANHQQYNLSTINPEKLIESIESGSLIYTNAGIFFIAVSIGEILLNGDKIFVISPVSPLGKLLLGKKQEQSISINNKEIKILKVI